MSKVDHDIAIVIVVECWWVFSFFPLTRKYVEHCTVWFAKIDNRGRAVGVSEPPFCSYYRVLSGRKRGKSNF
jgi:hypothetical protein